MSILVESLSPEHIPALRDMLEKEGALAEDSPFRPFWIDFLKRPDRRHDAVLVAHDGNRADGVAMASRRVFGRDGARLTFVWVAEARRRRGIGSALKKGLDTRLAALGVPRHLTSIGEGMDDTRGFLEATGFTEDTAVCVMQPGGSSRRYEKIPGVRCFLYTGGDASLNAGIADLSNWAFAQDTMVPAITGDIVEETLVDGDNWMTVAAEEETGKVAGFSECARDGFFTSIAVARRYWGTGLADWIADISLAHYRKIGIDTPWAFVRPRNRASLALHKRAGWRQTGTRIFFSSPTGAS